MVESRQRQKGPELVAYLDDEAKNIFQGNFKLQHTHGGGGGVEGVDSCLEVDELQVTVHTLHMSGPSSDKLQGSFKKMTAGDEVLAAKAVTVKKEVHKAVKREKKKEM